MDVLCNKTIVILSYWSYPFGGGEEYLYQTAILCNKNNMKCYWLSFANANNKSYESLSIEYVDGFYMIKIPNGYNETALYNWLKLLKPDLIHHQGHLRKEMYEVCEKFRVEFLTGIHFWNGVIKLDLGTYNTLILENYEKHSVDPEFTKLYQSKFCNFYSASKFVTECVEKITDKKINHVIYPGSLKNKCYCNKDPIKNKYVTIINIHEKKGGKLLLELLDQLPEIPFCVIKTEFCSEELDGKIEEKIKSNTKVESKFMNRHNDVKEIFSLTKIFLAPSIVDETFCRTVNEAMMNGIPVITTGYGNIKYLVGDAGYIYDYGNVEIWKETIKKLYYDDDLYRKVSNNTLVRYEEYSESKCSHMFNQVLTSVIKKGKSYNIMIMVPWCDQGLGIQARNYYQILKNNGYTVCIFSLKPYIAESTIDLQKNPDEWIVENIYYSKNDREHVKDHEILDFVKKYNIGKCIIPETCWFRIFEITKLLRDNDVKTYAIPNIEIVRRDEINRHKYFYKILCNNYICKKVFEENNVNICEYIGYGVESNFKIKPKFDKVKFLFIGGMNAFSRKNILIACEGFVKAYSTTQNISLTCTIQKTNLLEEKLKNEIDKYRNHPAITIIEDHLSYSEILDLYQNHSVVIQISKHEGLGLGFYEALSSGTPVLSLNAAPHNEIIKDNMNGWIIQAKFEKMEDNPMSYLMSAYCESDDFAKKIVEIAQNNAIEYATDTLRKDYNERLSREIFVDKFISALS